MAKGTNLIFNASTGYFVNNNLDFDSGGWKCALISDPITSLTVEEEGPDLDSTNINEVAAGGNYSTGGIALTLANVSASSVFTMALNTGTHSGGQISWAQDGSNPTNAKTAVIYDSTTTSSLAVCFIDITDDGGTTAVDMQGRDLEVNFGSGGNAGEILRIKTSN